MTILFGVVIANDKFIKKEYMEQVRRKTKMILYAENNQSIQCSKTNAPQIYNEKSCWKYLKAVVDEKEVKFYYSDRYQSDDFFSNRRRSGGYLYFQLDSQWYRFDDFQKVFYLGEHRSSVSYYIHVKGSFTTRGMNERKDGVRYSDIAQFELISENLEYVMKKINSYNPHIEVQVQDGKLSLVNKLSNGYIVTADN